MPRPYVRPSEELTPFARLIRDDYMWARKPNLSVAEFAELAGVHPQTVWDWINKGTQPKPATLHVIHDATGIPLSRLYHAAGLELPLELALEDIAVSVRRDSRLPMEAQSRLLACIKELRREYATSDEAVTA